MSRGKYLSLEEARKQGKLDQFAKEHSSKGKKGVFMDTLNRMAKKSAKGGRTSKKG